MMPLPAPGARIDQVGSLSYQHLQAALLPQAALDFRSTGSRTMPFSSSGDTFIHTLCTCAPIAPGSTRNPAPPCFPVSGRKNVTVIDNPVSQYDGSRRAYGVRVLQGAILKAYLVEFCAVP
jgi:hypothetical protein